MSNLRYISRDGKMILQYTVSAEHPLGPEWEDVPVHEEELKAEPEYIIDEVEGSAIRLIDERLVIGLLHIAEKYGPPNHKALALYRKHVVKK